MALGDIVNDEVIEIIIEVWREHLENGWAAKEIQAEVAKRVQEKWPGKYKPDWPGLRAVQNKLAKIKDDYKNYEKEYEPWNMGMLDDYPVPAEALPFILKVQKWADECKKIKADISQGKQPPKTNPDVDWWEWNDFDISLRQVHWIARLYTFLNWNKLNRNKESEERNLRGLWTWSKVYMYQELLFRLNGVALDTSNLDTALRYECEAKIMGPYYSIYFEDGKWPEIMGISSSGYHRGDSIIDIIKREKDGEK